jgi:acetyl-CoA carboxylase carboxyltransferase component
MLALEPTPLGAHRPGAARADLREIDGRTVAYAEVDGLRPGGSGAAEADTVGRALELAEQLGCPVVVKIVSVAVDPQAAGLDGLIAWGRVARRAVRLSGVVPLIVVVSGPVHGGLALILGLADHVVMTRSSTAYLNGPGPVRRVTGQSLTPEELGSATIHATLSNVATTIAEDDEDAELAVAELLAHLPDNYLASPHVPPSTDPPDRASTVAARTVPEGAKQSYDVRTVLADVFDQDSLLEVNAAHASNLVCAYARLDGISVAIVANQPMVRAGTLDIAASCKGARHVRCADAMGLPLITFVDTPGYEPGRDLEWRGMIRHGAKLVHAYASASVPRIGVILRKAYGGAYIVMDSRTMGNDLVLAWPSAQIAVMGAAGAVAILNRRELAEADDPELARVMLESAYEERYLSPAIAAERGLVDAVIDPADTRRHLVAGVRRLANKRPVIPPRAHDNGPL